MSLVLNNPKPDDLANEIWQSGERLSGKIKVYEYRNVILCSISVEEVLDLDGITRTVVSGQEGERRNA